MKKSINNYFVILFFAALLQSVQSCSPPEVIEKKILLHNVVIDNEDTTSGAPKYSDNAHGGKYYTHTDSLNPYGAGNLFQIPDSVVSNDISVKVNMWVRQGDFNEQNQIAVSLEEGSNIIQWSGISTKKYVKETRKWINLVDSITFPGSLVNKSGLVIKVFPYNPESTSFMDVDDLEILIYKVEKITEK